MVKISIKKRLYLLIIPLLLGAWFAYEYLVARPSMTYMGLPQIKNGLASQGWSRVLRNEGFMLEYSERLANPLWVVYKVKSQRFKTGKRPRKFMADWRSMTHVRHQDYTRSGYNRGHMAPNYLIATRYGKKAQKETFLMTNISPQKGRLNQKTWQRLEEVIANDFSQWHGDFWVVTGPIFDKAPKIIQNTSIAIPKAFYKILIKPSDKPFDNQDPKMALAFILPQNAKTNENLMTFITSIDDVEKQSGIDFFVALDDSIEERLEAEVTPNVWRLPEVANRTSRY
ncbi:DNA/RNA non-specific endonuclease [hydrothermal vent metagenome]|uniref:DNA/RNA non-specific endonuclease n=1 Tax=hydrothermal vent metagenome TaxID=652676 RepID=A0A3B0VRE9_9ZZZZ